jgi:hypothetical protein
MKRANIKLHGKVSSTLLRSGAPDDERAVGVYFNVTNIIGMCLPSLDLLHRIVIVYAEMHIISTSYDPLLTDDKLRASYRHFAHLEALHQSLQSRVERNNY